MTPAKARALARAERILTESVTLLQDAEEILQKAVEQDETYTPAATALKALHNRSNNLHDVTSDFVQLVIWEICNDLRQQDFTARLQDILQQHQKTLLKCHKEVHRRREALGQLTLLVMPNWKRPIWGGLIHNTFEREAAIFRNSPASSPIACVPEEQCE